MKVKTFKIYFLSIITILALMFAVMPMKSLKKASANAPTVESILSDEDLIFDFVYESLDDVENNRGANTPIVILVDSQFVPNAISLGSPDQDYLLLAIYQYYYGFIPTTAEGYADLFECLEDMGVYIIVNTGGEYIGLVNYEVIRINSMPNIQDIEDIRDVFETDIVCPLVMWNFDYSFYTDLWILQNNILNVAIHVYVIEREEITFSSNGLWLKKYNELTGGFDEVLP